MTDREWKALEGYVRDCADDMGLADWKIEVKREPATIPGAGAQMQAIDSRKVGYVNVCGDFREMPAEKQRHCIVHELVHFHVEPAWEYVRKIAHRAEFEAFGYLMEYAVDGIATAIACDFPLIEWPKK